MKKMLFGNASQAFIAKAIIYTVYYPGLWAGLPVAAFVCMEAGAFKNMGHLVITLQIIFFYICAIKVLVMYRSGKVDVASKGGILLINAMVLFPTGMLIYTLLTNLSITIWVIVGSILFSLFFLWSAYLIWYCYSEEFYWKKGFLEKPRSSA